VDDVDVFEEYANELAQQVSVTWNPRRVLDVAFGKHSKIALRVCRNWALGDPEVLKVAVSAACDWALTHNLDGKPGNYVRKSLAKDLPEIAQRESLDTWIYARKGTKCPACDGKGFDDGGPCQFCESTGTLKKRRRVRRNKQAPLAYADIGDGGDEEIPELEYPDRSRYDPDYQRSAITEGSPETVVNDAPPPSTEQQVQLMVANLLSRYTHERIDTATRRGAIYVLVDGMSYRDAAARITAEGHPISHVGLRDKLNRELAKLRALIPPEPERPRLHTSREGFGGRIPIWVRNWFLDGITL
jgi:hypothetical protein